MNTVEIILLGLLITLVVLAYGLWYVMMKREIRKQIFYAISTRMFLPEGEIIQKLQFHYGLSEADAIKWIKKYKASLSKGYPTYD